MRKIFGKLWLVWSVIAFIITLPFTYIAYFFAYRVIKGENKLNNGFAISKTWGKIVMFLLGIRVRSHNEDNISIEKQYVYICNHRSQFDIPVNFISSPQLFVILSKREAAKVPVVGTNLKHAHVTVDRKDPESRKQAMLKMNEAINAGKSVLLYPEGRRNRSEEELGKFKPGAFILAIQNKLPIVPVTIIGSDKINNPKNPLAVYPGVIDVYYDEPIATDTFDMEDMPELIDFAREKMLAHFTN